MKRRSTIVALLVLLTVTIFTVGNSVAPLFPWGTVVGEKAEFDATEEIALIRQETDRTVTAVLQSVQEQIAQLREETGTKAASEEGGEVAERLARIEARLEALAAGEPQSPYSVAPGAKEAERQGGEEEAQEQEQTPITVEAKRLTWTLESCDFEEQTMLLNCLVEVSNKDPKNPRRCPVWFEGSYFLKGEKYYPVAEVQGGPETQREEGKVELIFPSSSMKPIRFLFKVDEGGKEGTGTVTLKVGNGRADYITFK